MHRFLLPVTCLLCSLSTLLAEERPPNVVIIFTDDQGYGDIGINGAKGYETPNIDELAAQGRNFTQWYAAQAVCTASRVGLLTGCYPNRIGMLGALSPASRNGINPEETTLAEICKAQGYATAMFGKWHLGDHPTFLPTNHGFDEYAGIPYSNDMWPYHPRVIFPELPLLEGTKKIREVTPEDQKMMTRWLTSRAVEFIFRERESPFFLYVAHPQPHVPLYASAKAEGKTANGLYGDVIAEIDWSVGEIVNAIDTLGLDEDTLIIFTSDNGPWLSYGEHAGSTAGLREGKGTSWEGGVREPCVMRWTGKIPAGTTSDVAAMNIDILPTVAGLIGAELPERKIDGLDIWPVLSGDGSAKNPHDYYWIYYGSQLQAITDGEHKLVFPHKFRTLSDGPIAKDGKPGSYTQGTVKEVELYNLKEDRAETKNLAGSHPEIVKRFLAASERAILELGSDAENKGAEHRDAGILSDAEFAEWQAAVWPDGYPKTRKERLKNPQN